MTFSTPERHTIESFGSQLGLEARPARDGSFSFLFEASGTLTLTPSPDGSRIVVSLARHIGHLDADVLVRTLSRAGFDPSRNQVLHVGLAGDNSVLYSLCLDEGELSLPMLEDCLQHLKAAHDGMR